MANKSGNAYGLTVLCPLMELDKQNQSVTPKLRDTLLDFNKLPISPMCKVPNTYLSRFYILEDVFFQNAPYQLEHLKSKYLVFSTNFYGELDAYLERMFNAIPNEINSIWQDCYGFETDALNAENFKKYIKKCQVETTFYFDGSTDDPLDEQLKSLYLKQEFSKFVFANAHKNEDELLESFNLFVKKSKPDEMYPTWNAGGTDLAEIVNLNKSDENEN